MPLFTPEEHLEMCKTRERLREIKDKAQPYPAIEPPKIIPQPVVKK